MPALHTRTDLPMCRLNCPTGSECQPCYWLPWYPRSCRRLCVQLPGPDPTSRLAACHNVLHSTLKSTYNRNIRYLSTNTRAPPPKNILALSRKGIFGGSTAAGRNKVEKGVTVWCVENTLSPLGH